MRNAVEGSPAEIQRDQDHISPRQFPGTA
jgi:hypothetical protein